MKVRWMLLVLAVAAAIWGGPGAEIAGADCSYPSRGRRCTTPPSRPGGKALTDRMLSGARRLQPGERIVVPVVYHRIYDVFESDDPDDPPDDLEDVPPVALVQLQTAALNRAFGGTAISFLTAAVDARSFARWNTSDDPEDSTLEIVDMIHDLNAERRGVLHVFLMQVNELTAAPPETRKMFEGFRRRSDGILMGWDGLPYDEALYPDGNPSSEGETLVHLAGHYLGLLHTFEPWPVDEESECSAKCAQSSDRVRDTPVHLARASVRCAQLDTCPEYPGLDPVGNYMNVEPDSCVSEFSPGQLARIERMVRAFRPYLVVRRGEEGAP